MNASPFPRIRYLGRPSHSGVSLRRYSCSQVVSLISLQLLRNCRERQTEQRRRLPPIQNPQLGIPQKHKIGARRVPASTYLARLGIVLSRVPFLSLLGGVGNRPGRLAKGLRRGSSRGRHLEDLWLCCEVSRNSWWSSTSRLQLKILGIGRCGRKALPTTVGWLVCALISHPHSKKLRYAHRPYSTASGRAFHPQVQNLWHERQNQQPVQFSIVGLVAVNHLPTIANSTRRQNPHNGTYSMRLEKGFLTIAAPPLSRTLKYHLERRHHASTPKF
jgi:hypothetical protein